MHSRSSRITPVGCFPWRSPRAKARPWRSEVARGLAAIEAGRYAATLVQRVFGGAVEVGWVTELRARLRDRRVDLDALLRAVVDEATRRMDADRGTLYLLDHARGELVSRVAHLP